jgi:hypothetical protein
MKRFLIISISLTFLVLTVGIKRIYSENIVVSKDGAKFFKTDKTAGIPRLGKLGHNSIWIDINSDGCLDLFASITDHRKPPFNFLYINKCDGTFELHSNSGINTDGALIISSSAGDYDNDGLVDLILGTNSYYSVPKLYKNIGENHLLEVSDLANLTVQSIARSVSFVDFDADGFLDLFQLAGRRVFLYKNDGNGIFDDVTFDTSLPLDTKRTSSALWFDYNSDMLPDLLILGRGHNTLFRNEGKGVFTDVSIESRIRGKSKWRSQSACAGDIDNDGDLDVFVVNIASKRNALYINNSDGSFSDITGKSRIRGVGDGRTCSMIDYNSDGLLDIFTTNHINPSRLYRNLGNLKFYELAHKLNVSTPVDAFSSTWGDYNGDAVLDFFVNGHFGNAIFEGFNTNNSVIIELVGDGNNTNTSAIGSRTELKTDSKTQTRYVIGSKGCCENDMLPLHFGLGKEKKFELTVTWTSGNICRLNDLNAAEKRFYKVLEKGCKLFSY